MKLFWIIFFFLCYYPLSPGSAMYRNCQAVRNNLSVAKVPDISIPDNVKNSAYTGFADDIFSDTRFYSVPEAYCEYQYCYQYKQSVKQGIFHYFPHCFNKATDPLLELDMPPPLSA